MSNTITNGIPDIHHKRKKVLSFCDILFTVISLSTYLCIIVFDLVILQTLFALKSDQRKEPDQAKRRGSHIEPWFWLTSFFMFVYFLSSQIVSLSWYNEEFRRGFLTRAKRTHILGRLNHVKSLTPHTEQIMPVDDQSLVKNYLSSRFYVFDLLKEFAPLLVVHLLQLHVVWRHCKIFLPGDPKKQETEFCRLSVLRLYQGMIQGIPLFLIKCYLLVNHFSNINLEHGNNLYDYGKPGFWTENFFQDASHINVGLNVNPKLLQPERIKIELEEPFLFVISALISLFCVTWSLASFDKKVLLSFSYPSMSYNRSSTVISFTWTGIIFKLLANASLFASRCLVLLLFALSCVRWTILLVGFHWAFTAVWLQRERLIFDKSAVIPPPHSIINVAVSREEKGKLAYIDECCTHSLLAPHTGPNVLDKEISISNKINTVRTGGISTPGSKTRMACFFKKLGWSVAIAAVYVFCFIDLQTGNSKFRLTTYYVVIFVENTLMVTVWLHRAQMGSIKLRLLALLTSYSAFFVGILFLLAYYKWFHVGNDDLLNINYMEGYNTHKTHSNSSNNSSSNHTKIDRKLASRYSSPTNKKLIYTNQSSPINNNRVHKNCAYNKFHAPKLNVSSPRHDHKCHNIKIGLPPSRSKDPYNQAPSEDRSSFRNHFSDRSRRITQISPPNDQKPNFKKRVRVDNQNYQHCACYKKGKINSSTTYFRNADSPNCTNNHSTSATSNRDNGCANGFISCYQSQNHDWCHNKNSQNIQGTNECIINNARNHTNGLARIHRQGEGIPKCKTNNKAYQKG
ncbi:uncharacterized protein LOC135929021 [Gordionus sp. m RMFG-2023]|uniref:uncharacterized protein LOC135929021 n=1 Tax=Gordionus sp. m RMFG-2023 TaxID=3053472 RepID=UPI0031FCA487